MFFNTSNNSANDLFNIHALTSGVIAVTIIKEGRNGSIYFIFFLIFLLFSDIETGLFSVLLLPISSYIFELSISTSFEYFDPAAVLYFSAEGVLNLKMIS